MASRKRRRLNNNTVVVTSQKRPIDKDLIFVLKTLNTSQQQTVLKTTTFPCTVTGIRWSLQMDASGTADTYVYWAIVVVSDGLSASTMAISDGASFYQPEQNVLTYGHGFCAGSANAWGINSVLLEGMTKTMRKLKAGDELVLIANSNGAADLRGIIQFFCKS